MRHPRCLIRRFDGAILSQQWKETLWDKFVTGAPRQRSPSELQYSDPLAGRVLRSNVPRSASFARATERGVGHHSQDRREMAQAGDGRGPEDRTERSAFNGSDRGGGSGDRRIPASYAAPAGRRFACLYALQPSVPHLTRSALHRCLQRHGISRLPDIEGDKPKRQKFKRYPIGFFHIDIAEVQTAEEKLYLFVGIDRASKFAVTTTRGKGRPAHGLGVSPAHARSRALPSPHHSHR